MQKSNEATIFIKNLTQVDCSIFSPTQGIVGQSWSVDIIASGKTDENGFVYDFSKIKKLVKKIIKESVDHTLVIPILSRQVKLNTIDKLQHWELKSRINSSDVYSTWKYTCPSQAVFPLQETTICVDYLQTELKKIIKKRLPQSISSLDVLLNEQPQDKDQSFFCYTHGITNHDGQCKRLFHGHKSTIEVYIDNKRRHDIEKQLVKGILSNNLHIASISQLKNSANKEIKTGIRSTNKTSSIELSYTTSEGLYEASIPSTRILFIDEDTSIESLTKLIALKVKKDLKNNQKSIRVHCFEGISKGAIYTTQTH